MVSNDFKIQSENPAWKRLRGHLLFTFGKEAKSNGLDAFLIVESANYWFGARDDMADAKQRAMDVIVECGNPVDEPVTEFQRAIAEETLFYLLTQP